MRELAESGKHQSDQTGYLGMNTKMRFFLWLLGMLTFTAVGLVVLFTATGDKENVRSVGALAGPLIGFLVVFGGLSFLGGDE